MHDLMSFFFAAETIEAKNLLHLANRALSVPRGNFGVTTNSADVGGRFYLNVM